MAAILTLIALVVVGTFAWGGIRGAPWVPTYRRDVVRIIALAEARPGSLVLDLGCGSGSVLAAFAAASCRVRGWELAVLPWVIAKWRLRRARDARVSLGDFWNVSCAPADTVYAFLMPKTLPRLAEKLRRELRPGTRVLTYVWPLPGWTPTRVDTRPDSPPIYCYRV